LERAIIVEIAQGQRALEAELDCYGRVLGITPADAIAPVDIANMV
jgi:hypothetical protein